MNKKDQIIKLAFESFYKNGFQATAIDKLLLRSGISKRTLYKYFPTKEDLIRETILFYGQNSFDRMIKQIEVKHKNPIKRIIAIFDAKNEKLKKSDYSGCFAINATSEFDGRNKKIKSECKKTFNSLEKFIFTNCKKAGCKNPKKLAQQIIILLQGATIYSQTKQDSRSAIISKEVAKVMIERAIN
ncbi:MAG: TetR/AcrR family transcriptional regulator [Rickettsiales bacterium]|nr:TetR/AcrR family transcriptional regulator [Rickettsiales bacterium]